ncbi:hypothetical protein BB560_004994 [Smittium megazygosporum]|uniref:alanine--glyoxylate transaminase n=1 Tax=Smittium megazygosporum TaxID=133381 RepID=A0A2T9Z7Q0_9FUNG|nr:hypothetical protein BB560_004994 [Smittium megazygosporum]
MPLLRARAIFRSISPSYISRAFPTLAKPSNSLPVYHRLSSYSIHHFSSLSNLHQQQNMDSITELCMIPGPVEVEASVLKAMSTKATSHMDPRFIASLSELIKNLKVVFGSTSAQPFVIAGSGTLGWDQVAANILEQGDKALVLSNGYFGDGFGDCLKAYGADVTVLNAKIGDSFKLDQVEAELKSKNYKIVTVSHVDTSSGVVADVEGVCNIVKRVSPDTRVVVDSVCAAAAERLYMDKWGVDVVIAASQKALGCPPGVSIVIASQRVIDALNQRTSIMQSYEAKKGAYFATPCVQTMMALDVSVRHIVEQGMEEVFSKHEKVSAQFTEAIKRVGLRPVPLDDSLRSNAMSAVWLPEGISYPDLAAKMFSHGIVISGGIFKGYATQYFRIGHMGISATNQSLHNVDATTNALLSSLKELGYKSSA